MKKAYFAGGCFWCIAAAFSSLEGVVNIAEGYSGGDTDDPCYLEVKHQKTNHRETVCIEYDENKTDYLRITDFFFDNVDPFDPDGQFIDKGFSYTLAAFYLDDSQRDICLEKINSIEKETGKKVCISLEPFKCFYPAEEEHHGYAQKNPKAFEKEYESSGRKEFFERKKASELV